jgi:hypothetical protein
MIYEDLTQYSKGVANPIFEIKNIGWLDSGDLREANEIPYDKFTSKLRDLIIGTDVLNIHIMRTRGQPEKCCSCGKIIPLISGSGRVVDYLGVGQILIPALQSNIYYVAPSLALHYILVHGYEPPKEFIDSVLNLDLGSDFRSKEIFMKLLLS